MTIIDTHCHLDFPAFDDDRREVVGRAAAARVGGLVLIGIEPQSWRKTRELVHAYPGMWRAAGVHPNSVDDVWSAEARDELARHAEEADVVAIGETGIDLYRSSHSRERQIEAYQDHLALAVAHRLPIIIHQREAESETLDVLRSAGGARGVLHCFGGDWAFASECLELGLMLGIGGVATYPRSHDVRDAIKRAPANRLVLETDAPFLPPQGHRGKRNEPAFLPAVVEVVAECRSTTSAAIEELTTENAQRLFGIDLPPERLRA